MAEAEDGPSTSDSVSQQQGSYSNNSRNSVSRIAPRVRPVFERLQENGRLPVEKVPECLAELEIICDISDWQPLVDTVAGKGSKFLTEDQLMAIIGMLSSVGSGSPSTSSVGGYSRAPLRRVLTKNRSYLETGQLAFDQAVMDYITKLDDHRRKCEADGRYAEAKAAARRLVDLKTTQVERLRQELLVNQQREIEEVNTVYEDETAKFIAAWDQRIREYESTFAKAVEDLKQLHAQQREQHVQELESRRPMRPKPSREYLQQKRIEENLAKVREYSRASRVKEAADELYQAELEQAQQAFEVEQRLRHAKFAARQQQEFEALLQRGARGRDELERRRTSETERRMYRFRNIVAELENLHKLEVVHLENFLDGQVKAGKAVPLKDGFRRRREQLYSQTF